METLVEYLACQARGYSSNNTCYEEYDEFESYLNSEFDWITYLLLGLVPWSNLLFAIQVSDIKKAIKRFVCMYSSDTHGSQNKTVFTNNSK